MAGQFFGKLPFLDGWEPDIRANYGGSDRKCGLIDPSGSRWMVKYSEKIAPRGDLATSHVNNAVSEYVGSHVLAILEYETHETILGTLGGEVVVACRNFIPSGSVLIEFEKFMRKRYDSGDIDKVTDIGQLNDILENDPTLSPQAEDFKRGYWELFVADALIANFDRHKGNFGYLIGSDNSVRMAPVYDNGSSFHPRLSEAGMEKVLSDPKEIMKRVALFPKAALKANGTKIGYWDALASGMWLEPGRAAMSVVPRMRRKFPEICRFIDGCDFLSPLRRKFYKTMLAMRMALILDPACRRCEAGNFDGKARLRIESGKGWTERDFENDWKLNGNEHERKILSICDRITKKRENCVIDADA